METSPVMKSEDSCSICLSAFEQQTVASLHNCQHVFCLDCILRWSQTANTCPVDRIGFDLIYQMHRPGGDIQRKIQVKTQTKDVDDEEQTSETFICEECGRSDRRHQLVVCVDCDSGYHMNCLTPPLSTAPDDDWICSDCVVNPPNAGDSMLEEEISDGEVTDLLDEFDGTASIMSRLRPSTVNRPSSPAERRRSARLQSRTNNAPSPHPQTTLHVPKYLIRASRPAVRPDDVSSLGQSDGGAASVTSSPPNVCHRL